jgi:hypothetical protein
VTVPPLEAEPKSDAVGTATPPAEAHSSAQKTLAFVALGVGVVGLAVGSAAGIFSLSKNHAARSDCPVADRFRCPTEAGADEWNAATTAGTVSTVGFVAAGVGVATGVALWLTAPSATRHETARAALAPVVGRGFEGAALTGRF